MLDPMKTAATILRDAARRLEKQGWRRGMPKDYGTPITQQRLCAGDAIWCGAGLHRMDVHQISALGDTLYEEAMVALVRTVAGATEVNYADATSMIVHWNDHDARSGKQVVAKLRKAAEAVSKRTRPPLY